MRTLFSLLAFVFFIQACWAASDPTNLCTANCDRTYTTPADGRKITWCGMDDKTHTSTMGALQVSISKLQSDCYSLCGISVKHVGPCGCPNDCYNDTNNGECNLDKKECKCKSGWKGADCFSVNCPDNKCSGNGKCKKADSKVKGSDDFCVCNHGYTGHDCSVKIPAHFAEVPYGTLPFGSVNLSTPLFKGEKNGDSNPLFNVSTIATIKITLKEDDLNWLLDPQTRRVSKYQKAHMWFDNGNVKDGFAVEFRIKGLSSRMSSKKNWNIRWEDSWHNTMGFGLKAGLQDHAASYPLSAELYRMMGVATQRVGFCNLFVNGWFYGIYAMHERFDADFMKSRWDVKDKNMYQLGGGFWGQWWGSTPHRYQSYNVSSLDGIPINYITQQNTATEQWDDLVMLTTIVDNPAHYQSYLPEHFDIGHFIRYTAVDLAIDNIDSYYSTGGNWMLMNWGDVSDPKWVQFPNDFDGGFQSPYGIAFYLGMTQEQLISLLNSGVYTYYGLDLLKNTLHPNPYVINNRTNRAIANAIYNLGYNATFTATMTELVQRVVFNHPGRLLARYKAFVDMTRSMMKRDKMFYLPFFTQDQTGAQSYELAANDTTPAWMKTKFSTLANMFISKGNGNCDGITAVCTCLPHYSGPTCQTYTA